MSIFNRPKVDIETTYQKYADLLYRVALANLSKDEEAQDIVQDVFVKYMTVAPVFISEEHEKAWLLRVTINRCHDTTRYFKIREHLPLDEVGDMPARDDGICELMYILAQIPDKYRDTLILHCLEGFSQQETARILGVSLSAVKMRIVRGREILAKIRQEESDVQ